MRDKVLSQSPATSWALPALALVLSCLLAGVAYYGLQSSSGILEKLCRLGLYLAPLPLALALSRRYPAERSPRHVLASMVQDSGYFALTIILRIVFTVFFINWVAELYQRHLDFLTWRPGESWPLVYRVLLALLISDFLGWFHHYVRHRFSVFWEFHKVHHSQTHLNYFSDFRMHPLDYIAGNLIIILPQLMVQVSVPTIVILGIIVQWHTIFYHCNIRTNYGPLRYLFVNPQSHRVHHSTLPQHHGKNFGVIFSIWDQLFRTQCRDYSVYPATGVEAEFPVETSLADVLHLRPLLRQLVYPFKALWKHGP